MDELNPIDRLREIGETSTVKIVNYDNMYEVFAN